MMMVVLCACHSPILRVCRSPCSTQASTSFYGFLLLLSFFMIPCAACTYGTPFRRTCIWIIGFLLPSLPLPFSFPFFRACCSGAPCCTRIFKNGVM
ncbi:uncharacterized protein J3D65DRAFT_612612 [Phyllosticta citribraziliensis]|uniref:Secreted peptide n=1 Tax=Phyllosticta citribraziliensis TaxID=989973 RepID=A0ABR1M3D3_9PEZI